MVQVLPGARETADARELNVNAAFWAGVTPTVGDMEPSPAARRKTDDMSVTMTTSLFT